MKKEKIHIGNLIKQTLKEKDLTVAWLARQVFCNESNFCKKLNKNDITVDLLHRISDVLREDFFACYSKELNSKWQNLP
jgi:plasmid maintenance system antidote protein VapI